MAEEVNNERSKEKRLGLNIDLQMIIIGLMVFLLCMGGAYFMFRSLLAPLMPREEATSARTNVVLVEIGEFITNIDDISGTRFLKAGVYVEVIDEKSREEIEALLPVVKDEILSILSAQTVADLDARNRENLRNEIKHRLNKKIGGGQKITGVYFTAFIMQ